VSIPRCFDGPEAYSIESELGRYGQGKIGFYIGQAELCKWYMMERYCLEPGFSKTVRVMRNSGCFILLFILDGMSWIERTSQMA
jgi:hypothetical protein